MRPFNLFLDLRRIVLEIDLCHFTTTTSFNLFSTYNRRGRVSNFVRGVVFQLWTWLMYWYTIALRLQCPRSWSSSYLYHRMHGRDFHRVPAELVFVSFIISKWDNLRMLWSKAKSDKCKVQHIILKLLSLQIQLTYQLVNMPIKGVLELLVNCIPWRQEVQWMDLKQTLICKVQHII